MANTVQHDLRDRPLPIQWLRSGFIIYSRRETLDGVLNAGARCPSANGLLQDRR
jgi:hypothetical protein